MLNGNSNLFRRGALRKRKYYVLGGGIVLTVAFFAFLVLYLIPNNILSVASLPFQKTDKFIASGGPMIYRVLSKEFNSIPNSQPPRQGAHGKITLENSNLLIKPGTVKGINPTPHKVHIDLPSPAIQIVGSIYPGNRYWCFTIVDGVSVATYNQDGFVSNDSLSQAKCFGGIAYTGNGQALP